jgi:hypothetical protein
LSKIYPLPQQTGGTWQVHWGTPDVWKNPTLEISDRLTVLFCKKEGQIP